MKIEDHLIGLSNPVSVTSPNPGDQDQDYFYTNLLKNRISELEKQLADKNAIIDFLSLQIINKPPDTQVINRNDNHNKTNDKSDQVLLPQEKQNDDNTKKDVVALGDSLLNNINSRGLSKSKKVEVMNYPGATKELLNYK